MNTLIILSILIGHLWADQARAEQSTTGVKGLITNAAVPKSKGMIAKGIHKTPIVKVAPKVPAAPAKPTDHVQKLIPLEPSKKIETPAPEKPAPSKEAKPEKQPAVKSAGPKPIQPEVKPAEPDKVEVPETEKTAPEKPADPEAVTDKLEVSIDTVGIESGGNWLSKRVWYERSQDMLQEIANELSNILATRQQYLVARDTLDDTLEEAFIELGFDQGKLTGMLDHLLESLKEEQEERGDLTAVERKLRLNIEKQQKDLEQLKLDLESLKNLDDSLDAAVKRVMEQINLAGMYNKEAHSYFDEIPKVHEQRAKALYYKIDTLHKDMLAIKGYLSGQLAQYLQDVQSSATMHIAKIKSEVATIQAKGIDFKKQLRILEGSADTEAMADKEDVEDEDEADPGFFGGILDTVTSLLTGIWNWVTSWF